MQIFRSSRRAMIPWRGSMLIQGLLGLCLVMGGCTRLPGGIKRSPQPAPTTTSIKDRAKSLSQAGRTLIESKKGRSWLMEAAHVDWNEDGKKGRVHGVDWTLRDSKGEKVMAVKAPSAWIYPEGQRVEFEGLVVAERFPTNDRLRVNHLIWEGKSGLLLGSRGVIWQRGTTMVKGDNMRSTDKLERIEVTGHVKAQMLVGDSKL